MAANYTWPGGLPQNVQKGYSESSGLNILRTPMDAGIAKERRRGKKPSTLSVNFLMTTAQVSTFETFVLTTIKGTSRFYFPHPRLGTNVEVRIIPSDSGMYTVTYQAPGYYTVAFTMEVLP